MSTKHTPTPLTYDGVRTVYDGKGEALFKVQSVFRREGQIEEIVHVVNSHDALIKNLKNSIRSLEWVLQIMPDIPEKSTFREDLADAKESVAQAEVQS